MPEVTAAWFDEWKAVSQLCRLIQSELDGDTPIHSTEMQNALNVVQDILRPDEGYGWEDDR